MASDKKKAQTVINALAIQSKRMQEIAEELSEIKKKMQAIDLDTSDTALQNKVTSIYNWIDTVNALASSGVPQAMIESYVQSHKGKALDNGK